MISYPDVARNMNMYTDLTKEFSKKGHDVYVAAPDNGVTRIQNENGIIVLRIKTLPLFDTGLIKKGLANILLPYQYKNAINKFFKNLNFDLIITPTPPITFLGTVSFLKKKNGSKIYLILRDIFPQNAKDLGLINNIAFSFFRKKEKKLYMISDQIGCMSQRNIEFVHSHNPDIDINKLHLLPNWTSVDLISPFDQGLGSSSEIELEDKFTAVFGGNFGIPQNLEFLIEVAEKIRGKSEIVFLLIGEGTEKRKIEKLIKDKGLSNVKILDTLPRDMYMKLLKECDVGLVNLSDKFTIPNIPSRTLSYWSVKLPVLAAIDRNTDFGELLSICNGGLWSFTGDHDSFITNLMFLFDNPAIRKQLGENGYNYLTQELNSEKACMTILSHIQELVF